MSWTMIGKPFSTAEMSSAIPQISQRFRVPVDSAEKLLHGVGLGVILYGDPAFTALTAELWADRAGSPIEKIADFATSYSKAQLLTQYTHGFKYVGLQLSRPVPLRPGSYYHVAMRASGYTGDANSHLAWRHAYPNPQYSSGLDIETINAAVIPLEVAFFMGDH